LLAALQPPAEAVVALALTERRLRDLVAELSAALPLVALVELLVPALQAAVD
jgi:hypothetical protein